MNMVKMTMNELSQELTAEELREQEAAEKNEPVFDDESPVMMQEQLICRRMHYGQAIVF